MTTSLAERTVANEAARELTLAEMERLEPRLLSVWRDADADRRKVDDWCAYEEYKRVIKRLVGYDRIPQEGKGDDVCLYSSRAYELCIHRICDALWL